MVMDKLGNAVSKFPVITVVLVVVITLIAAGSIYINGIESEFSEESFLPDLEITKASDEISSEYTSTRSVSILVKSKNGDVLTSDALVDMLQVQQEIVNDPEIQPTLERPMMPDTNANSVANAIAQNALNQQNVTFPTMDEMIYMLQNMTDEQIKLVVMNIMISNQTALEVKGMFMYMLTKDFDLETGNIRAKGTMIMVSLNASLDGESGGGMGPHGGSISNSEKRMDEIAKDTNSIELTVLGSSIIMDEIMDANNKSMMILLPLAFGFVVVILAIIYRSGLDMLFSLLALLFAIIWVYGFGAAMGYSFNPITTAVPILIVGLGIDYGIHVTMRYREEINAGKKVEKSIKITIQSVGMALLLATVTTVIAFLSNLSSPISLLGEFGVLSAIGIIGSFITMTTFVPAIKQIRDLGKLKKGKPIIKNNKNQVKKPIKGKISSGINKNKSMSKKTKIIIKAILVGFLMGIVGYSFLLLPGWIFPTIGLGFMLGAFVSLVVGIIAISQSKEVEGEENIKKEDYSGKSIGEVILEKTISSGAVAAKQDPVFVIIVVALLTVGATGLALQLETTFDFEDFLPEDLDISKDLEFMLNEFEIPGGEAQEVNILVKGDISDPALLRAEGESINNMGDDESVLKHGTVPDVKSILSFMQDWATNSSIYGIPDQNYDPNFEAMYYNVMTAEGVPNANATNEDIKVLFDWLYMNPYSVKDTKYLLDRNENNEYEGTVIRISVDADFNDNEEMDTLINDLEEDKKPLDNVADKAIITSGPILTKVIMDMLNESQVRSLIITIIVSLIVLTIVFYYKWRSLILGAITITPVIFCVLWTLATMYLVNIPLNVMTITIASLTVGLGITYGIHITHRFLEDIENHENIDAAAKSTVTHTGTALFGAAATTIAGFGLLVFALIPPLQQFGGITALTILYSFLSSVFILPTFLVLWAKWRAKREGISNFKNHNNEIK
jgi:predicted RND superfamily exporter protein